MTMPNTETRLRAACEKLVDRLALPHGFSTRELCQAIAARRGRPIKLRPLPEAMTADAPCGIRIELPDVDLLLFEEGTSVHHRRHILTHELCHVYCDHPGSVSLDARQASAIGINTTLVARMSGRTSYTTADEREAETMASIIRQRMYRHREMPSRHPARGADSWDALFARPLKRGRSRA
ncbi:regulator component [Streptomyces sp. NPDC060243]|uniref:regulator component n=1 Tax=Streptomyces sp. NPDC060243 TaxID=3347081 RepID=UPI003651596C